MAVPGLITLAIHYWTTPGPYAPDNPNHANSPAVRTWHAELLRAGLIIREADNYTANNEAMRVYMDALCNVPFPVQKWVMPDDSE